MIYYMNYPYVYQPCQRKVTFRIPEAYISSGKSVKRTFMLGKLNMESVYPSERRSCFNGG